MIRICIGKIVIKYILGTLTFDQGRRYGLLANKHKPEILNAYVKIVFCKVSIRKIIKIIKYNFTSNYVKHTAVCFGMKVCYYELNCYISIRV